MVTRYVTATMETLPLDGSISKNKCVMCGCNSERGVTCKTKHFLCSDTCLEILADEHLGKDEFACPVNGCSEVFCIRDLYGKVNADVFSKLVREFHKQDENKHLNESMNTQILKQILHYVKTNEAHMTDVLATQDELLKLSRQTLDKSFKSFEIAAEKMEYMESQLEQDRRSLQNSMATASSEQLFLTNKLKEF